MRRVVLVAALAIGLAACAESQSVKTTAEPVTVTVTTESPSEEPTTEATTTEEEASDSAGVGDTITLHGYESSLEVGVTLAKVADPDESYDHSQYSFEDPEKGKRYVSFLLVLENTGSDVYDDSPTNGIVVIDSADHSFDAADSGFYTRDPDLGSPKIRPGDRRQGWVTFMVPKRSKLRTFQMTLESGFADETGEWTLS